MELLSKRSKWTRTHRCDQAAESADQARSSKRFLLEARTLARLSHPNTVRIFESGRDRLWAALLGDGVCQWKNKTLVLERGQLAPELAIYLTVQICSVGRSPQNGSFIGTSSP